MKNDLNKNAKVIEVVSPTLAKHQQDLVMHQDGICRCICVGCHGSTPHLLKVLVVEDEDSTEERI